jgi:hypothetical protein
MSKKLAWTGSHGIEKEICCEKLAREQEIGYQDGVWYCYGDGVIQVSDIQYCPFCGTKLPKYEELQPKVEGNHGS